MTDNTNASDKPKIGKLPVSKTVGKAVPSMPKRTKARSGGKATVVVKKRVIKTPIKKSTIKKLFKPTVKLDDEIASRLETKSQKEEKRIKRKLPSKIPKPGKMLLRPLTPEQKKARSTALGREKLREKEMAERAKIEAAAELKKKEQEDKIIEEEKARKQAESLRQQKKTEEETLRRTEGDSVKHVEKEIEKKKPTRPRTEDSKRRQTKLTIFNALDENEKQQSLSALRRRRQKQNPKTKTIASAQTRITREVIVPEFISVADLADRMAVRSKDVIKFLLSQDIVTKVSDNLDADTAELVVGEFGHKVKRVAEADIEETIDYRKDLESEMVVRPPVVTIMGHVDHGKTSLLDALRKTSVVDGEAGGITQHIGAYQTQLEDERLITFIDTPGHAAFTSMRARGAQTTDIVVIVIAADDEVMPQTIESINHAKASNTPIIVALNKIDLEGAAPDKIMQQLLQYEIVCEPMGGEVQAVPISAKTKEGLGQLGEAITLQADILELKANPNRLAQGVVLEAKLDKGAGHVATVLVQRGTLKKGDIFVAGTQWGKVRRMMAFDGSDLKTAEPACPVWVSGLQAAVEAGDKFDCVENEALAREISQYRLRKKLDGLNNMPQKMSIEDMFSKEQKKPALHYIIKSDVQGSADAIGEALKNISSDEIDIKISHAGVGDVNLSDVMLAQTVNANILIFNARVSPEAQKIAKTSKIVLRQFEIIYALIDEVKEQIAKHLGPQRKETHLGTAEILQLFSVGKKNVAAGCRIDEGQIRKNEHIRISRDDVVVHEGVIQSLRHFKENVAEVKAGSECGIVFVDTPKLEKGDLIECFNVEQVARTIE